MKKILTDGAGIVAKVAYKFSQVVPVYQITPSTPMAEKASTMAERGEKNILGQVVKKIEMQSEAGVSGTLHGALLSGATGTTLALNVFKYCFCIQYSELYLYPKQRVSYYKHKSL